MEPFRAQARACPAILVMAGEGPPSTTLLRATKKAVDAGLRRHDTVGPPVGQCLCGPAHYDVRAGQPHCVLPVIASAADA
jgi:hypothetical protein